MPALNAMPEPPKLEVEERQPVDPAKPQFQDLPSDDKLRRELTFNLLPYSSPEDGKVYQGTFKARRLTIASFGAYRALVARLNGGLQVDPLTENLHSMLGYLTYALVESPDWWSPGEMDPKLANASALDTTLLRGVHDHARQWESSFRK